MMRAEAEAVVKALVEQMFTGALAKAEALVRGVLHCNLCIILCALQTLTMHMCRQKTGRKQRLLQQKCKLQRSALK